MEEVSGSVAGKPGARHSLPGNPVGRGEAELGVGRWGRQGAVDVAHMDGRPMLTWMKRRTGSRAQARITSTTVACRARPRSSTAGLNEPRPVTIIVTVAVVGVGITVA